MSGPGGGVVLDAGLRDGARVLESNPSWGGLVAVLEHCIELAEGDLFGDAERDLILSLLIDPTWKPAARFELCVAAGEGEGFERALELLRDGTCELELSLIRARRVQRLLVAWSRDARAGEVWLEVVGAASWIERRVLLNTLEGARASGLVPALARFGVDTDPVTRAAIVDAMARIGHPCAIPFLRASLSAGDAGVAARAARALADVGDRSALEDLLAYQSTREGAELGAAAIAAIEERFPSDGLAQGGSISQVEVSSEGGALSVVFAANSGDLELHERASEVVASGLAPARALEPSTSLWRTLSAAPRRLPLSVVAQVLVLRNTRTVCGWLALVLFASVWAFGPASPVAAAAVSAWFACTAVVCAVLAREDALRELDMLRLGGPSYAGVTGRIKEQRKGPRGQDLTLHRYRLTFMDDGGVTWNIWRSGYSEIPELEGDDPLPVLSRDARSMLRSELGAVRVLPNGHLGVTRVRMIAILVLPALATFASLAALTRWIGVLLMG